MKDNKQDTLFNEDILKHLDEVFKKNKSKHITTDKGLENLSNKITSSVPSKLARTGLFTTKSRDFITDSNYNKLFVLDKYSTILVSGRELGVQHRKLVYSLFKIKPVPFQMSNPLYDPNDKESNEPKDITRYRLVTSWREILTAMDYGIHRNNVDRLLGYMQDMQKVVITVFEDNIEDIIEKYKNGIIPKGHMSNVIQGIQWDEINKSPKFDEKIVIEFGQYTNNALEYNDLASLNMKVLNKLKRDYSASIWPYINSQGSKRRFIMENDIASLVNFDFANSNKEERKAFRRKCKQSFEDMIIAGGVSHYGIEEIKNAKVLTKKYFYTLKPLAEQLELPNLDVFPNLDALPPEEFSEQLEQPQIEEESK
tara:strand:+ start:5115 stop:6218 length:1104 start_codon:yes stop_codon:yes gene_type:complete